MPTLSAAYNVPQRGTNDDFNDTFAVTATGTVGAYTCADAWGTYTGTFVSPLTNQENLFVRNYSKYAEGEYAYWLPGADATAVNALAAYVNRRFATTGNQILSGGPQGQPDAWQSHGLHSNAATTWGVGPNKVRSGSNLAINVASFVDGVGTVRYKFVAGSTTNTDVVNAWNAYILNTKGNYPTVVNDSIFFTDIYWWALTTAPLQGCREPATNNAGSAYVGPYIAALKRKWGPQYGL